MRTLNNREISLISGSGVLTGLGVFLILLIVDEIAVSLRKLQAPSEWLLLQAQLDDAQSIIGEYKALYGELPVSLMSSPFDEVKIAHYIS